MAIVRREVSDRSGFGKFVKWTFIAFNILMLIWLVSGLATAGSVAGDAVNDAERAGAAIGTALGAGFIVVLWAIGDVILGVFVLLTRRKKIIEVEE